MPNNLPSNLIVNFLVFQAPDIFTKLNGISVADIKKKLGSDWLRAEQFKYNTSAKRKNTSANFTS